MLHKRGKGKVRNSVCIEELYKYYKAHTDKPVKDTVYRAVRREFFKKIVELIFTDAYEYKIGERLGYLKLIKYKQNLINSKDRVMVEKIPIDWGATNKLREVDPTARKKGKLIRCTNPHTDGWIYTVWWDRRTSVVHNVKIYRFTLSRANDRLLAALLKDENRKINAFMKPVNKHEATITNYIYNKELKEKQNG